MLKTLLNGLLALLILVVVVCIVAIMVLDSMGRSIVQTAGSEGLGVPVTVKSVHIGFFSNDSHIKELSIANPEGFSEPTLLSVEQAGIDFSVLKLLDTQIVIPNATIAGVYLDLEQSGATTNIETVIHNIASDESPEPKEIKSSFVIETLRITDITVTARGKFTVVDSGSVTAHIKEIVMHDVGTNSDGEVAIEAITSAVTHAIMDHLAKHPAEGLSKLAFSHVTGIIDKLPVFKQLGVGNLMQDVTDGIGKGVDEILGGVGDLLGGKKK
ncbi:MAG: AsmA family protein [Phycisphaerales bacterium]|nr:AsmA family protein [Phycisphaerales bacterium]